MLRTCKKIGLKISHIICIYFKKWWSLTSNFYRDRKLCQSVNSHILDRGLNWDIPHLSRIPSLHWRFFFFYSAARSQCYSSVLQYIEAICSDNVVGDPGDGRSEMTSSLSNESKRKEGGGGGTGRGRGSEQRTFHHPVRGNGCFSLLRPHGFYSADSCWTLSVCVFWVSYKRSSH